MDLQSLATAQLLRNLPLNSSTQEAIDQFITDYVKAHPAVLTRCIQVCGTYHVFAMVNSCTGIEFAGRSLARERDPFVTANTSVDALPDMDLISVHGTESDAVEWVLKYGRQIIYELKTSWNHPKILTVVYLNGQATSKDAISHYEISSRKHLSFAFDDAQARHHNIYRRDKYRDNASYRMLLDEHETIVIHERCKDLIPYWIRHVKENGEIFYGCTIKYLALLSKRRAWE
ncbi:Hypothetical protein POVR1_LOCUS83 [uncultured virus]|nr:Hypothetical protein POVR1_LOCUS83 [uncultured virus]